MNEHIKAVWVYGRDVPKRTISYYVTDAEQSVMLAVGSSWEPDVGQCNPKVIH